MKRKNNSPPVPERKELERQLATLQHDIQKLQLEQDHRFIKRMTKPIMGFKALHSASATIVGIEVAHMIRKKQFANDNR